MDEDAVKAAKKAAKQSKKLSKYEGMMSSKKRPSDGDADGVKKPKKEKKDKKDKKENKY